MIERRIPRGFSLILASVTVACSGDSHSGAHGDVVDDTGASDAVADGSGSGDASDAADGSGPDGGTGPDGGADDVTEPDASDATDAPDDSSGGGDARPDDGGQDPDTSTDTAGDTHDVGDVPDGPDEIDATDTAADGVTPGHPCAAAGGICTAGTCGDATEIPSASAACAFDDGPGLCCAPPQPEPTGETCSARGGVCAPIAGCGFVSGYFASASECSAIGGPAWVCCIPESQCGPSEIECCAPPTVFRSTCDRGEEVCTHIEGSTPVPLDTCLSE